MAILTSSAVAGLMAMSFTSSFGLHLAIYIPLFVLLLVLTVAFFRDLSRHSMNLVSLIILLIQPLCLIFSPAVLFLLWLLLVVPFMLLTRILGIPPEQLMHVLRW